jgi:regulator of Ty1 transposition protein 103
VYILLCIADTSFKRRQESNNGEPAAKQVCRRDALDITSKENKTHKVEAEKIKKERKKSECNEVVQFDKEGKKEVHVILSPKHSANEAPPEPDELIKTIQSLENAASSDANVREKIAQLPSEVSDASQLVNITGHINSNY